MWELLKTCEPLYKRAGCSLEPVEVPRHFTNSESCHGHRVGLQAEDGAELHANPFSRTAAQQTEHAMPVGTSRRTEDYMEIKRRGGDKEEGQTGHEDSKLQREETIRGKLIALGPFQQFLVSPRLDSKAERGVKQYHMHR